MDAPGARRFEGHPRYIAKDSKINAANISREMLRRADSIEGPPQLGRKVPELNDETIREIPVHSWRLIYHIRQNGTFILALVHKRRDLLPEQISPSLPPPPKNPDKL